MEMADSPIFPPRKSDKEMQKSCVRSSRSDSSSSSSVYSTDSSSSDDSSDSDCRRKESKREKVQEEPRGPLDGAATISIDKVPVSSRKVDVDKDRTRELRRIMSAFVKSDKAAKIKEFYDINFNNSSFSLSVPKLDRSVARRLKDVKTSEAKEARLSEKAFKSLHGKVLDISRPLIYMWAFIASDDNLKSSPLHEACLDTLLLWGRAFQNVMYGRRGNIIRVTDPRFEDLVSDEKLFSAKQLSSLFGRKFLKRIVREAKDDRSLRESLGRPGSSLKFNGRGTYRSFNNRRSSFSSGFAFNRTSPSNAHQHKSDSERSVVVSDSSFLLGGNVRNHIDFWETFSSDRWILDTVIHGFSIPFLKEPKPFRKQVAIAFSEKDMEYCRMEITSLLTKDAVELIPNDEAYFLSNIFVVPKHSGGNRLIINLKPLNEFVHSFHFKMEGIHTLKDSVRPGDFFTKLDLKDAYLAIPVKENHRKFLQFYFDGNIFQFKTLCFGLSCSPWAFTKLLRTVVSFLHSRGIRLIIYLDDFLILNETKVGREKDFHTVKLFLMSCGFFINHEKSQPIASQSIEYLGLIVDSTNMTLSLRQEKLLDILSLCSDLLFSTCCSLRILSKLLGLLNWGVHCVPFAQSHFRAIQNCYNSNLLSKSYDELMELDADSLADIFWWKSNILTVNGRQITPLEPDFVIFSDASSSGWGASMNELTSNGPWTSVDSHDILTS